MPELTPKAEVEEGVWEVYVDGFVGKGESGVGILIKRSARMRIEHVIHFGFSVTNNEVEYKVFIAGARMTTTLGEDVVKNAYKLATSRKTNLMGV